MNLTQLLKTIAAKKANLQTEITRLDEAISALAGLSGKATPDAKAGKKGGMSAAGRARIAAAQRKRWAKHRAGKGRAKAEKPTTKPRKKYKLSAAGRAKIVAAAKARAAKQKAAKDKVPF